MKTIFNGPTSLLALLCTLPFVSNAQLTIDNGGGFNIGDVLKFVRCDADGVQPGAPGADVTWDFSNLDAYNDTITEWLLAPSSTAYASAFPAANLVEKYSDGRYVFLNKSSNESLLVGYRDSINDITIHYPDPVLIAQRPTSYGDITLDAFTAQLQVGVDMEGAGTVTLHADGYGTLILPNATYTNVLRVKISQVETDSIAGVGTYTTYVDNYVWYDNAHASALLKIDTTYTTSGFSSKNVSYLLEEITGVENRNKADRNNNATFVGNTLVLFGEIESGTNLELYDANGRLCSTKALTPGTHALIETEATLAVGFYWAVLKRDGEIVDTIKVAKPE